MSIHEHSKPRPPRVLLVDDDRNVLAALELILRKRCDLRILSVTGCVAALDALAQAPFACIVADAKLPGIDGAHMLQLAFERYPYMRRVIYTGHAGFEFVFADAVLIKGEPPAEIAGKICELAYNPRS